MTTATMTELERGTWTFDPAHSSIGFVVRHLMAAKVRGSFKSFSGTIDVGDSVDDSSAEATIQTASVDTGADDRDNHLRSEDFFGSEEYPEMTFRSNSASGTPDSFQLDGDLTIRDVTKPVTLDVTFHGVLDDPWGNAKAMFSAETEIDREEWGLTWNQALETGGVLVGKKVTIEIEAQAARA